jgi:hypothetical protein
VFDISETPSTLGTRERTKKKHNTEKFNVKQNGTTRKSLMKPDVCEGKAVHVSYKTLRTDVLC